MNIPLSYRAPNPPVPFVGRAQEVRALEQALERARTIAVCGAGGIGKSALVSCALERRGEDAAQVVYVELGALRGAPGSLLDVVLRALCAVMGYAPERAEQQPRRGEEQLANIIDMADALGLIVALDDLHLAQAQEREALVRLASRCARHARWVFISREALPGADVSLSLGPMDGEALRELAWSIQPDADARSVHRLARAVIGSPWRMIQALRGDPDEGVVRLEGYDEATRRALWRMAALTLPQSAETLDAIGVARAVQAELVAQSLAIRTLDGVRLHDMTRELLASARDAPDAALLSDLLDALGGCTAPHAALDRARLAARHGRLDALTDTLEAHGEALMDQGYAPELWAVLQPLHAPEVATWRLLCAHLYGSPEAIEAVDDATIRDDQLRLRALRLQHHYERGDYPLAERLAGALRADAEAAGEAWIAVKAAQHLAVVQLLTGRAPQCVETLGQAPPLDDVQRQMDMVLRVMAHMRTGEQERAREVIDALYRLLPTQRGQWRSRLAYNLCLLEYQRQEYSAALELFTREIDDDPIALTLFAGRKALLLGAALTWLAVDIPFSRALLERLETIRTAGANHQARHDIISQGVALMATGRLDAATVEAVADACAARAEWDDVSTAHALLARRSLMAGTLAASRTPSGAPPTSGSVEEALLVAQSALRHDQEPPPIAPQAGAGAMLSLLGAMTDLMRDNAPPPHALAALIERAQRQQLRIVALELLALGCLVDEGGRFARDLAVCVVAVASPRYRALARFWAASASGDVEALLALAFDDALDPDAEARRYALGMLGAPEVALDAWERRAITRAQDRLGWSPWLCEGGGSAPLRVVDPARKLVVSRAGGAVSLERDPTPWRLLVALLDAGHASKEALVSQVWGVAEYHPLHHDNRLRLAARNLRKLVEDDPKAPTWVVTREDGYGLTGRVVVLS